MTKAEATALVRALEAFIDANIASAIRQQMPEYAYQRHEVNELHDTRKQLIEVLSNAISVNAEL